MQGPVRVQLPRIVVALGTDITGEILLELLVRHDVKAIVLSVLKPSGAHLTAPGRQIVIIPHVTDKLERGGETLAALRIILRVAHKPRHWFYRRQHSQLVTYYFRMRLSHVITETARCRTHELALAALERFHFRRQTRLVPGTMERHVTDHLSSGLKKLVASLLGTRIGAEHLGMSILHVAPQRVPAQQRFAAQHAHFDEEALGVRAVDERTRDIVEVRLLGLLKGLGHRNEIVQSLAIPAL
jgi:hypothetical protein